MDAIKEKLVDAEFNILFKAVCLKKKKLDSSKNVRYLYATGKLEGGHKRATNPIWSLKVFNINRILVKKGELVLYYLKDSPKRGFIREELRIVPSGTKLPPKGIP